MATTKQALKKLSSEGGDLQTGMWIFLFRQHMVISATGKSPSQVMFGRELRSRLDLLQEEPKKQMIFEDNMVGGLKFRQGEVVMVKDYRSRKPTWTTGRIRKLQGKTVCLVDVRDGTWKRHFDQLRQCCQDISAPRGYEGETERTAAAWLATDSDDTSKVSDDEHSFRTASYEGDEHDTVDDVEEVPENEKTSNDFDVELKTDRWNIRDRFAERKSAIYQ